MIGMTWYGSIDDPSATIVVPLVSDRPQRRTSERPSAHPARSAHGPGTRPRGPRCAVRNHPTPTINAIAQHEAAQDEFANHSGAKKIIAGHRKVMRSLSHSSPGIGPSPVDELVELPIHVDLTSINQSHHRFERTKSSRVGGRL